MYSSTITIKAQVIIAILTVYVIPKYTMILAKYWGLDELTKI